MNQYEVLYAVKDYDDADQFFADIGEAPRFWQSSWHFESTKVFANNMSDAQKKFYRKVDTDDGRECVFVKAQFIRKLQYSHQIVVAVRVNPNFHGWRIRTFSIRTNSESPNMAEIWDLLYQELKKNYLSITSSEFAILELEKEGHLDVED